MYIDAHCDSATAPSAPAGLRSVPEQQLDLERLSRFMGVQVFALFFNAEKYGGRVRQESEAALCRLLEDMARNRDLIEPLLCAEQLLQPQKLLGMIGAEGGELLDGSLENLQRFFDMGLRLLGLTWNHRNALAGGAAAEGGITAFGRATIACCESLGVIVDGAHLNRQSFWELQDAVKKPYIISHTCCDALFRHRRNLDDGQLRAVAEHGGVVGITFAVDFLGAEPSLETVAEHIAHAVKIAGAEHIGIGSDFDGAELPRGISGVQDWLLLDDAMRRRGILSADREKILGNNFLRVFRECLP